MNDERRKRLLKIIIGDNYIISGDSMTTLVDAAVDPHADAAWEALKSCYASRRIAFIEVSNVDLCHIVLRQYRVAIWAVNTLGKHGSVNMHKDN